MTSAGNKVGQGVDQQRFGTAVGAFDRSRQSGHELDEGMVKKWHPHLKGVSHTHGIRVAQQSIDHVGSGFQTGHGGEIIKLFRSSRRLLEPILPRFRRVKAIAVQQPQHLRRGEEQPGVKIRVRQKIGVSP